jgi:hypothetical protein
VEDVTFAVIILGHFSQLSNIVTILDLTTFTVSGSPFPITLKVTCTQTKVFNLGFLLSRCVTVKIILGNEVQSVVTGNGTLKRTNAEEVLRFF